MNTHRLELLFLPMPEGEVGPPVAHVAVKSSFHHEYPGIPDDLTLLTPRECGIVGLEQQVAVLQKDLDAILASARKKYAAWEQRRQRRSVE